MRQDYDNPWKEMIEEHFRVFAALLLPWIERDVDWSHAPESLEQELRRAHPRTASGKRLVDKLLRLLKKGGDIRHLHVELQSYFEEDFEHRVWQYNKDAGSLVGEEVVSVAVLVDDDPEWRPDTYHYQEWGCEKTFTWPVMKLTDWRGREEELAADSNPFALFVLSHLWAQATRDDAERRETLKLRLIDLLAERKMDEVDSGGWMRLFDWQLQLPPEGDARVMEHVAKKRREGIMPFVSSFEKAAMAEGMEKGMEKGMERGMEKARKETLLDASAALLEVKFSDAGKAAAARLAGVDLPTLEAVYAALKTPAPLEQIVAQLP